MSRIAFRKRSPALYFGLIQSGTISEGRSYTCIQPQMCTNAFSAFDAILQWTFAGGYYIIFVFDM